MSLAPQLSVDQPEIVEVNPKGLNSVFGPPDLTRDQRIALKRDLLLSGKFVQGGDWDIPAERQFEELEVYEATEVRVRSNTPWDETHFFRRVLNDFERGRTKWGCETEAEFRERCDRVDELRRSIESNGFLSQKELGVNGQDDVRIGIRRDGTLLFLDGRHRLAIARVLGLDRIPVRIVVRHAEWADFKQKILGYAATHDGRIYQTIDHPDLRHIPAGHDAKRIEMIASALRPYAGAGLSLLDIGTHWGYMCQKLEALGFQCHGIELNRQSAEFAERLGRATSSKYEVWRGSVFDFPEIEKFDVVLALNIFHHFIKTEELHERLTGLLSRIRAKAMVFEPHRHDPPAQMADAYRNYSPEEFVEFVCRHAGFRQAEELGTEPRGRRLFILTR